MITNVGKEIEKLEPLWIAGGNLNGTATLENILVVLQDIVHGVTILPSNFILGYISNKMENTSAQMFIAVLFTITKKGKQLLMPTNW